MILSSGASGGPVAWSVSFPEKVNKRGIFTKERLAELDVMLLGLELLTLCRIGNGGSE